MNNTNETICFTCQISNGLSTTEQHGIIILVVVMFICLVLCFTGILWFGFHTRLKMSLSSNANVGNPAHNNEAFNNEAEDDDDDYEEYMQNMKNTQRSTTEQVNIDLNDRRN